MSERATSVVRQLAGRKSDWGLRKRRFPRLRPSLAWTGPIAMVASVLLTWPAFAGAQGEEGGSVAFGLFIGAASIVLMAWSFLLAIRWKPVEPFFGGLDRAYKAHRWAGTLAVIAMFLHTSVEPEIEGGIRGASESLADQAEGLAGFGEIMLYLLVGISLVRWFPYRYWRWTHKLLGIPFAFASWHFFTAEKTYANGSPWGWYFGAIMIGGLVSWVARVVGKDMVAQGTRYRVASASRNATTTELLLDPVGDKLDHEVGQFAVLKVQERGLTEPHAFTIASSPSSHQLRFFVRDLGDWTTKIGQADLRGTEVIVEGPYGMFEPFGAADQRTLWVAGGVGITPFLSAIDSLEPAAAGQRPTLLYCVRDRHDASAVETVEAAAADGRIDLEWFESSAGRRFSPTQLGTLFGDDGLRGAHVAVCGPTGLVESVAGAAYDLGAHEVETEGFDIRGGFGPDLSQPIEDAIDSWRDKRSDPPALVSESR